MLVLWIVEKFSSFVKKKKKRAAMNAKEKKFWTEFLELYESMPCLWKIKSTEYANREIKSKCYNTMVEKLKEIDADANRDKVVKKINTFRTNYRRDLKKVKQSEKSGAGVDDIYESSLWYFENLKFLENQECSLEGRCSMDPEGLNVNTCLTCSVIQLLDFLTCIYVFFRTRIKIMQRVDLQKNAKLSRQRMNF